MTGEGCIQEHLVERWARLSGKWIDEPELYLEELCQLQDRGTESESDSSFCNWRTGILSNYVIAAL